MFHPPLFNGHTSTQVWLVVVVGWLVGWLVGLLVGLLVAVSLKIDGMNTALYWGNKHEWKVACVCPIYV